jgi:hypothetical protein
VTFLFQVDRFAHFPYSRKRRISDLISLFRKLNIVVDDILISRSMTLGDLLACGRDTSQRRHKRTRDGALLEASPQDARV